ncbi:hypothetical protein OG21DRAFT_1503228 [Imleria badia]|nr:hypothetical protein OG21DRAFT_1503228 [Imleria badia]
MPSYTQIDLSKTPRGRRLRRKMSTQVYHRSTASDIPGIVSESVFPLSSFQPHSAPYSPPESTITSTIYRNTSDAAQTFLSQVVADVIPGVGSIIKGAIGGILSSLQLVNNKDDLNTLRKRLCQLCHHMDNVPTARTPVEETLRRELLGCVTRARKRGWNNDFGT